MKNMRKAKSLPKVKNATKGKIIHKIKNKIEESEVWDSRELGASEQYVRKSSSDREDALNNSLGLQTISIRLQKNLIESLKKLAEADGIGYQPYVRQLLMRHVRQQVNESVRSK